MGEAAAKSTPGDGKWALSGSLLVEGHGLLRSEPADTRHTVVTI